MKLKPQEFDRISTLTLEHYHQRAGIISRERDSSSLPATTVRPPRREQQPWLAGVWRKPSPGAGPAG